MFTVLFREQARDELAQIWLNGNSQARAAITSAAAELERSLHSQPRNVGEARDGDTRIGFIPPLGFLFSIHEADRSVIVLHVWQYGQTAQ